MEDVLIPIFGIVMTMGIPIIAIIFFFLHRMQRTRAIRTALERGGELPPELLAELSLMVHAVIIGEEDE